MSIVEISIENETAIVRVNNPPVNALSHAVRDGLYNACEELDSNDAVKSVVLVCDGRTFISGADIREFNQPPKEPHLPDLINRIERASKPWIAAVHGSALGGGCEITLGCHYRVAVASSKFGLPEVNLGLIPGAGGTIRMPRVVGLEKAIEIITSGKPISAGYAQNIGLVDVIAPDDNLLTFALEFARQKAGGSMPVAVSSRPAPELTDQSTGTGMVDAAAAKAKGQIAPVEAVQAVLDGLKLPFEEALAAERKRFLELKEGEQSAAMRHAFFAERQTTKIAEIKGIEPKKCEHCGVIGGGTMGAGIATAMLLAGMSVTMIERDGDAAAAGHERVTKTLKGSLSRGLISEQQYGAIQNRFVASDDYSRLSDVDLVVEAVFEDMGIKKQVFEQLEKVCRDDAILASNTSYLDVNELAASTANPSRVLGLHFFSPAHIMKLVEVIKTDTVSPEVLATGFALAKILRKTPVLSGVCDGFIGNRILASYRKQCDYMLEDGAAPQDIDAAMRNFGMAMGPFEMQDMAGLDIGWANRKRLAPTRDPNERYVKIADRICELGRFGQKTGAGWYEYPEGSRKGIPDPIVEKIIAEERKAAGITTRNFTMAEIQSRILKSMVSEGQKILDEGIARSAADIDVVFILGYGFPRWRGGPMFAGGVRDA